MLLELADELAEGLASEDVEGLEEILRARREGLHLLTGRDEVFTALTSTAGLSEPAVGILRRSRRRQVEKAGLREAVNRRVRLSRDTGPSLERKGDQEIAIVPLRHFAPYGAADRATVLGEGEHDVRMAVRMAKYFAHTRDLDGVRLRHWPDAGGGGGTSRALRRHRERGRLCLCVVDSDRLAPGCMEGRTATDARREICDACPWIALHVLACRQMENTIPRALMAAAYRDDHQKHKALSDSGNFDEGAVLGEYREYCDFNAGTWMKWVFDLEEARARQFWLDPEVGVAKAPCVKEDCLTREVCTRAGGECACVVALGFGPKLLKTCVDAAEGMADEDLETLLCGKTRMHWRSLGRIVFSWTCGTGRSRT